MGDVGRGFYVKPDIPDMFKKELVPLADIVCPNQFELEALTGIDTSTIENAIKAINILHETGPSVVLVTSFREKDGMLSMLASNKKNIFKTTTPELPLGNGVAGTGDMTTAVFLSHYLETGDLEKTLFLCTASVFGILETSYKSPQKDNKLPLELKLIAAQQEFVSPSHSFNTVKII